VATIEMSEIKVFRLAFLLVSGLVMMLALANLAHHRVHPGRLGTPPHDQAHVAVYLPLLVWRAAEGRIRQAIVGR
jgi:hypothetical protein